MTQKVAVVLFNLGGPDKPESVRPFLFNLFNDKNIITAPQPIRFFLAWLISKKREKEAQEIYAEMGGKSPLLEHTQAQATALEDSLNANEMNTVYKVFIAMRYWHPMAAPTVEDVKDWDPDQVALLPLYPQYSTSTTGSSVEDWLKTAKRSGLNVPTRTSCCYPTEKLFINAHVDHVSHAVTDILQKTSAPLRVLFSAHGLPEKFIENGDPYRAQIEATVAQVDQAVREKLPEATFETVGCFQSRVGPLKWTEPYTDKEIERAGKDGCAVLVCPIAFVSDHSETIVELGSEYRELAEDSGVPEYDVVPVLGTHKDYISCLKTEAIRLTGPGPEISSHTGGRFCGKDRSQCPCMT